MSWPNGCSFTKFRFGVGEDDLGKRVSHSPGGSSGSPPPRPGSMSPGPSSKHSKFPRAKTKEVNRT